MQKNNSKYKAAKLKNEHVFIVKEKTIKATSKENVTEKLKIKLL